MNRLGPGIQGALHADAEEFAVVGAGAHVIDIAAVADFIPVSLGLGLVLVIDAIEAAVEIVLIFAPGHAGHDMDTVAMVAPGGDAGGQIGINAINDGDIGTEVAVGGPRSAGLKTGAFERLAGIDRRHRIAGRRPTIKGSHQGGKERPPEGKFG